MRDTAEVFDHHAIDDDVDRRAGAQRPRGRDRSQPGRSASSARPKASAPSPRSLADYPDVPLVAYMPNLVVGRGGRAAGLPRCVSRAGAAADRGAGRQPPDALPLPAARLGRRARRRRRASSPWPPTSTARATCSSPSVPLPDQFLDNVLASPQGAITGEKFERFEAMLRRRRRHAVGRARRAARHRHRPARRGRRGARLPRPLPRRRLSPGHGQRRARPLVLGPAAKARTTAKPATTCGASDADDAAPPRVRAMSTDAARQPSADRRPTPSCSSAPGASSPAA